jgi:hypothetical protein
VATTYKVLGQSNPSATTATTLYTVPAATQAVVSSLTVCNQSASNRTYRIAVRVNGAALAAKQYVVYDATLLPNCTETITLGLTLGAADVLTIYASAADLSFAAFGSEIA